MDPDTDPFGFPNMPDEAVAAVHEFLEELYLRFQNHYFAQMHRWYLEPDEPIPSMPRRWSIRRSDKPEMTAARTPRPRSMMDHRQS